jgi:GNAT superfamily N-acetyltransferase
VFEIQAPTDAPTWGQIKYLAADGDHQGGGHGMSAMRAALLYIRAHAADKKVRLWADNFSETYNSARLEPNRSAVSFYEKLGMEQSDDFSPKLDENGAITQIWMVGSIDVALQRTDGRCTFFPGSQ